jgi:hypothetical protein
MMRREPREGLGRLVVGLYAWLMAVAFGAVLLDIVYSRLVPEATAAFAEVADLLLLIDGAAILVALVALGLTWTSRLARSLVVASLIVVLFGFSAPPLLGPLLRDAGPVAGALTRIGLGALSSLLAFVGAYAYYRRD